VGKWWSSGALDRERHSQIELKDRSIGAALRIHYAEVRALSRHVQAAYNAHRSILRLERLRADSASPRRMAYLD